MAIVIMLRFIHPVQYNMRHFKHDCFCLVEVIQGRKNKTEARRVLKVDVVVRKIDTLEFTGCWQVWH